MPVDETHHQLFVRLSSTYQTDRAQINRSIKFVLWFFNQLLFRANEYKIPVQQQSVKRCRQVYCVFRLFNSRQILLYQMEKNIRQQLTLFVDKKDAIEIESIRKKFNPKQQLLIAGHVTLCREDEIANIDKVLDNLQNLDTSTITIQFGQATRFDNNKGVLLPASGDNEQFQQLRKKILAALNMPVRRHEPHITLMHPRNSNCNDQTFEEIKSVNLPTSLRFDTVSLIEQIDGGQWQIINKFNLKSDCSGERQPTT